jgi:transcriptional regulator with XRE-family HTH domain
MNMEQTTSGIIPVVKIDGAKVRRFREEKGLTQLYVSTVVGVTTDTISRWENRRYPTIKKENAHKLAEALEVALDEIIDHELHPADEPDTEPLVPASQDTGIHPAEKRTTAADFRINKNIVWFCLGIVLLLAGAGLWWRYTSSMPIDLSIRRSLPNHAAPGQPFPVLITITTDSDTASSLIVKESLPPSCMPLQGQPDFTTVSLQERQLKWISKLTGKPTVFSYMVTQGPETRLGQKLIFAGTVTTRQGDSQGTVTSGDTTLSLAPYHWADSNRDGRIDDEEILTVYDTYGAIPSLDIGRGLIEEIWSAKGYRWNLETGQFIIIP